MKSYFLKEKITKNHKEIMKKLGFLGIIGLFFMLGFLSVEAAVTSPEGQVQQRIKQINTEEQQIEQMGRNPNISLQQLETKLQQLVPQITTPEPSQNAPAVDQEVHQQLNEEFQQQGMPRIL